jgi:hypothetical protein
MDYLKGWLDMEKMTPLAAALKRQYQKNYRERQHQQSPEKRKEYDTRYWNKKAAEQQARGEHK